MRPLRECVFAQRITDDYKSELALIMEASGAGAGSAEAAVLLLVLA